MGVASQSLFAQRLIPQTVMCAGSLWQLAHIACSIPLCESETPHQCYMNPTWFRRPSSQQSWYTHSHLFVHTIVYLALHPRCFVFIMAIQGRMWEDAYKEMNLPESSFEKFQFSDGYPKVSCSAAGLLL